MKPHPRHRYSVITIGLGLVVVAVLLAFSNQFEVNEPNAPAPISIKAEQPPLASQITALFVGDIMLARKISQIAEEQADSKYPFLLAANYLKSADLTFANLENPVSMRGVKVGSIYSFRAKLAMLEGLTYAGIDVVNLANNHIWDYGRAALEDTFENLDEQGIAYIGAGRNYEAAHTALIKEVKGVKIAFLGYTNLISPSVATLTSEPAVAFIDQRVIAEDIKRAKEIADIVILSFHWGEEYQTRHNAFQERVAHAVIDAGADLVIGHHPHVPQDLEQYQGKWIAYSLGNFVFDQNFSADTSRGLVLLVTVQNKAISQVKPLEVRFTDTFQPFFVQ